MLKRVIPLLLTGGLAYAGPPLLTDDPEPTEQGHWEINLATTATLRGHTWTDNLPLLDASYGLLDAVEVSFDLPFVLGDGAGHGSHGGIGDADIGTKWRFMKQDKDGITAAIGPDFAFNVSSSAAHHGLVPKGWGLLVPLEVERELGGGNTVFGEFGYRWNEYGGNGLSGGVAMEHEFSKTFSLMGEMHLESGPAFRNSELVANAGFLWKTSEHTALLGSIGRGLTEGSQPMPKVLGYLAVQFTF